METQAVTEVDSPPVGSFREMVRRLRSAQRINAKNEKLKFCPWSFYRKLLNYQRFAMLHGCMEMRRYDS